MSAVAAVLLGLTACTDEPAPPRATETATGELQVCADGATVPGIDVSKWQGQIDWAAVRNSGIEFAFIRVSHGTGIIDEWFVDNWANAQSVGVLRGAYQFFSADQDPIAQADLLLDRLETYGAGELPPVLDVETTDGQSVAVVAERVGRWLAHVEAALGTRPIIYTGSYFWNTNVQTDAFRDYPLWIAHWGVSCPNLPTAWSDWAFWQTSSTGRVPGISGNVDTDVFNGDLESLRAFGVDPECRADAEFSDCQGDLLRVCDETAHLVVVDCEEGGGPCSLAGGTPHCVDLECASRLDEGEDGTFCLDADELGSCASGVYQGRDCAAEGRVCGRGVAEAACVDPACADALDGATDGRFCLDGTRLGECAGGDLAVTDCGQDGTTCDASSGTARCVEPAAPNGDDDATDDGDPVGPRGDPDGTPVGEVPTSDSLPDSLHRFAQVPESGLEPEDGCRVGGAAGGLSTLLWLPVLIGLGWAGGRRRSIGEA